MLDKVSVKIKQCVNTIQAKVKGHVVSIEQRMASYIVKDAAKVPPLAEESNIIKALAFKYLNQIVEMELSIKQS